MYIHIYIIIQTCRGLDVEGVTFTRSGGALIPERGWQNFFIDTPVLVLGRDSLHTTQSSITCCSVLQCGAM